MYHFTHQMPRVADPAFSNHYSTLPYTEWPAFFDDKAAAALNAAFDPIESRIALVGIDDGKVDLSYRNQYTKVLQYSEQTHEHFVSVLRAVDAMNYHHFNFALWGMEDLEQCSCPVGSHFDAHVDRAPSPFRTERKMTCIVSTTHADEYEGGTLRILPSGNPKYTHTIKLDMGDVVLLPSWTPYSIDEVTSGTLTYVNTWLTGPKFA